MWYDMMDQFFFKKCKKYLNIINIFLSKKN